MHSQIQNTSELHYYSNKSHNSYHFCLTNHKIFIHIENVLLKRQHFLQTSFITLKNIQNQIDRSKSLQTQSNKTHHTVTPYTILQYNHNSTTQHLPSHVLLFIFPSFLPHLAMILRVPSTQFYITQNWYGWLDYLLVAMSNPFNDALSEPRVKKRWMFLLFKAPQWPGQQDLSSHAIQITV